MNPKLWDIHATYGDFLMNNQRFKEAEKMYKKVKTDNNINKNPGQRHQFMCFFPPIYPMYVCLFVVYGLT